MKRVTPAATWATGGALLALWGASFGLSYVDLGAAALPVALAIALAKAALVVGLFMELVHAPLSMKLALASAVAMVALMVGLMATDVATRPAPPLLPVSPAAAAR